MLIDLPDHAADELLSLGYNVKTGSFGTSWRNPPQYDPILTPFWTAGVPDINEHDILVINNARVVETDATPDPPKDNSCLYFHEGAIAYADPRPLVMNHIRSDIQRIIEHGGLIVVFAHANYTTKYLIPYDMEKARIGRASLDEFVGSNWDFLALPQGWVVDTESGSEIYAGNDSRLASELLTYYEHARFHCVLEFNENVPSVPLLRSKFGDIVGALHLFEHSESVLLVIPPMPEVASFLPAFIENWALKWSPHLFPEHTKFHWIHLPDYEADEVLALRQQQEELRQRLEAEMEAYNEKMLAAEGLYQPMYNLLQGTGDELVQAVIWALRQLGLERVVDVDAEELAAGNSNQLAEDIRIEDRTEVLVVDVKGINGCPSDPEMQQPEKHAFMRMRQWKGKEPPRTAKPLFIVNHERHKPPLERNPTVFRKEMAENANHTDLGLMTTWDLFRLVRMKERYGWQSNDITPIFYRNGVTGIVPAHYEKVGKIVELWEPAFGTVPDRDVGGGDRLAVECGCEFLEFVPDGLMVNGQKVESCPAGADLGVAFPEASKTLKMGANVYLVERRTE